MNRELFISQLQPGDALCICCLNPDIFQKEIQWAESDPFHHVVCYLGNGKIDEAILRGFTNDSLDQYLTPDYIIRPKFIPSLTPEQAAAMVQGWHSMEGQFYGFFTDLGLAGLELAYKMGFKSALHWKDYLADPNMPECAEAWGIQAWRQVGFSLGVPVENYTPAIVAEASLLGTRSEWQGGK